MHVGLRFLSCLPVWLREEVVYLGYDSLRWLFGKREHSRGGRAWRPIKWTARPIYNGIVGSALRIATISSSVDRCMGAKTADQIGRALCAALRRRAGIYFKLKLGDSPYHWVCSGDRMLAASGSEQTF